MRKVLILLVLLSFGFSFKLACINTNEVLSKSTYFAKLQQEYRKEVLRLRDELTQLKDKIDDLKGKIDSGLLSEKAKEEKLKEYMELQEKYRKLQEEARKKLLSFQRELRERLLERLKRVLSKISKEKALSGVLDCQVLLYKGEVLDITDEVIKGLDKNG